MQIQATQRTPHPHLFAELRKRNERRARVARMLEARRRRSPEIARIAELQRKHRPAG